MSFKTYLNHIWSRIATLLAAPSLNWILSDAQVRLLIENIEVYG